MNNTKFALLVGMHFRPPAKAVLARLPSATALILSPDPENQYDPDAVKVICKVESIPASAMQDPAFAEELIGCGITPQELAGANEVFLGYCAKEEGKPFAKAQASGETQGLTLIGARSVKDLIAGEPEHKAALAFAASGAPLIRIDLPRADCQPQT